MLSATLKTAVAVLMPVALMACGQPVADADDAAPDGAASEDIAEGAVLAVDPTGKVIEIRMYTIDPEDSSRQHVFKPNVVSAQVGDTIRFIPSEPSHQSSSIETMLPEGVTGWEGEINEQVDYVLPKPGIYGYQCIPHYAAGMVGVVVVDGEGRNANLERAMVARHPGLGNPKFVEVFEEARERGLIE